MFAYLAPRVANVSLRALVMGSKFALVIVLARLLAPAEVGLYGLFTATVGFSMLVIGGDYYTYSQRELLSHPKERWSFVLQHQALATLILYAVLLPAQAVIFWLDLMPKHLAGWFFALLIAEHIAQEINRLLVVMHRQLLASAVLFIRTGAWAWFVLPIMWIDPSLRNLNAVLVAWLVGCLLASLIGGMIIWREVRPWKRWELDRAWLRRGFAVGLMFLVATMCFRALQTFDRYTVKSLAGADFLGAYVLYTGVAMSVMSVLEPAVFSFLYPRLVSAYRQGDQTKYRQLMRELAYSAAGVSVIVAIAIAVLAPFVFVWTDKPIYTQHLPILWLLLGMTVIYAVGMVPHYGLYARGADKTIVFAHVSSLLVFGVVVAVLATIVPQAATACALIAAFLWMGLFKLWRYRILNKDFYQTIPATIYQEPASV